MARSRYGFDEAKIARFQKEGRGAGGGRDYKPWLTVRDVPSTGRVHRFGGRITGRVHHLLSDLEFRALLIYDLSDAVTDIREQFPLDREATRRIAEAMGIRHPADTRTGVDAVVTTDLVIDLVRAGRAVSIARAIKPSDELDKPRTLEKLETERRYWAERDVDWGIVTKHELPMPLVRNLKKLSGCRRIDDLVQPYPGALVEIARQIDRELPAWAGATLREFCAAMDIRFGLETGVAVMLVHHLVATKAWITDMAEPIDETTPMTRFARRPGQQRSATA